MVPDWSHSPKISVSKQNSWYLFTLGHGCFRLFDPSFFFLTFLGVPEELTLNGFFKTVDFLFNPEHDSLRLLGESFQDRRVYPIWFQSVTLGKGTSFFPTFQGVLLKNFPQNNCFKLNWMTSYTIWGIDPSGFLVHPVRIDRATQFCVARWNCFQGIFFFLTFRGVQLRNFIKNSSFRPQLQTS